MKKKPCTEKQNKLVRKGDKVMVIAGNDRGLMGTVISRTLDRVVVQGINVRKRHMKKNQRNPQGGIISIEKPIHISNVKLVVDESKARKVRLQVDDAGGRQLVFDKEGETVVYRALRKSS